jgi:hypothetical protein
MTKSPGDMVPQEDPFMCDDTRRWSSRQANTRSAGAETNTVVSW